MFLRSLAGSKGRFLSIVALVALGSFALVGLLVAGPDMRAASRAYFDELNLADLTVISDLGLDEDDVAAIDAAPGASAIEYGYFKDVTIEGTTLGVRVMSATAEVSQVELVDGRMPEGTSEIALDSGLEGTYELGDVITVSEKADSVSGDTVLVSNEFTVVGFVTSAEIVSTVNMGQSTAGTGALKGYAVVDEAAFDSDVYMIARLVYEDTKGLDPYGDEYAELIQAHREDLEELLEGRPAARLATVRAEAQEAIDEGQAEVDEVQAELSDAAAELEDAAAQIAEAQAQIDEAREELAAETASARAELDAGWEELDAAAEKIAEARAELEDAAAQIADGEAQVAAARTTLEEGEAAWAAAAEALEGSRAELEQAQAAYEQLLAAVEASGAGSEQLEAAAAQIAAGEAQLAAAQQELDENRALLDASAAELAAQEARLEEARAAYEEGAAALAQSEAAYEAGLAEARAGEAELAQETAEAEAQIAEAEAELADETASYEEALEAYEAALPDAEGQIAEAEEELEESRERIAGLTAPAYSVDSRRETPGSDGYGTYDTISEVIDALARVFPVFLYLVAALVTLTTMTRMVDEERTTSGALKALGYSDADIARRFVAYGALAGGIGAVIGIALGHTLLPNVVFEAYSTSFSLPAIRLEFHPGVALLALALAALCSALPAWVAARRELRARPAELLLPKAPAGGSKIALERLRPVWERLSFSHKVTARNLFRYKQRMFMTVLGVAGAVAILVTGFGVQSSIQKMSERQFGSIVGYDMIVASSSTATVAEEAEVAELLEDDAVESSLPVHYETLYKLAGDNGAQQSITLIVPEDTSALPEYVTLRERASGESLELGEQGAVISERLSTLLGVSVGDVIEVTDEQGAAHEVTVSGITEMYMGHFMFLSQEAYEGAFGTSYESNASLVVLADGSTEGVEETALRFMALAGVESVVQNTSQRAQVDTIVAALDNIMEALIMVASLLGAVIMYNLTNLNVSERMRELSTIKVLGFRNDEATMYIYRETVVLTALGVLVGFAMGVALHEYVLWVVPPDNVMFDPALSPIEFVVPAVVTAGITAALHFVVLRRLRRVDMLEALKSVD